MSNFFLYPKQSILAKTIEDSIIFIRYSDMSRVGKDDYNKDYLTIANIDDDYILDCIFLVLESKKLLPKIMNKKFFI